MAIFNVAATGDSNALGHYLDGGGRAHDGHGGDGSGQRNLAVSVVGTGSVPTFLRDVKQTRLDYGKDHLKVVTYHGVLSFTNEELDPSNPEHVALAHGVAREIAQQGVPGHQARIWIEADNGRTVMRGGVPVREKGKLHAHYEFANVAEAAGTIEWVDKNGVARSKSYEAGRAFDGDMKNVHRLRAVVDAVVAERLGYDNARFVIECREAAKGRGDRPDSRDYADRADPDGPGYSSHDEVRVKLRGARALATDWDDYTARLGADAVSVQTHGKGGASYAWVGDDGVEHRARARKLGNDFTRASVEDQCRENSAAIARGEQLVAPDPDPLPAPPDPATRPRPVFLTPDGRPPWERDGGHEDFAGRVAAAGGTYEQRARAGLDAALDDSFVVSRDHLIAKAPDHGVEVEGRTGEVEVSVAAIDGQGAVRFEDRQLGAGYGADDMDAWIKTKGRTRNDDSRGTTGSAAGGRSDDTGAGAGGVAVNDVDSAGVAARRAAALHRKARERAELDDGRREPVGGGSGAGGPEREGRGAEHEDRGAEQGGRGAGGQAGTGTPRRRRLVGNPARADKGSRQIGD
ncbi:hypothetical protein [Tsukamurella sp. USMM236]|uniref:hypothetical protein n=1 Tax=Tsukamurella sp. USMM236 TaxID=3081301 RepID=UPI00301AA23C